MGRALIAAYVAAACLGACAGKPLKIRGLIELAGEEGDTYPREVQGSTADVFLRIDEVPSVVRGGGELTVSFAMGRRSNLRQLSATLFFADQLEDVLLDNHADVIVVTLPPGSAPAKVRLRAIASDLSALVVETNTFYSDGTAPVLQLVQPAPIVPAGAPFSPNATCTDDDRVSSATCTLGTATADLGGALTLPTTDSIVTLTCWCRDRAGNESSTTSESFTVDASMPSVNISQPPANSILIGGQAFDIIPDVSDPELSSIAVSVSLDGGMTYATLCSGAGACSTVAPNVDSTDVRYRVTAVDSAGNTTVFERVVAIDSTPPTVSNVSFGSAQTIAPVATLHVDMTDAVAGVTEFCSVVRSSGTPVAPGASDPCWIRVDEPFVGVAPGASVSFDYDVFLDVVPATYTAFVWGKDGVGKISLLSDSASITLVSDAAPVVSNVIVNTNDGATSGSVAASGSVLYVKWSASDTNLQVSMPIGIYITNDDLTYRLLTQVANGQTGACTGVSGGGCALLAGVAPGGYFRIRVTATDVNNQVGAQSSPGLNSIPLRVLAGNTDPGTGTTATRAILHSQPADPAPDAHTFVVTRKGVVYFLDAVRGLMRIRPASRTLELLIPQGTPIDDGPIAGAKLRAPLRIALDDQDGLLVFDYDRVRRMDPQATTITTVIGTGNVTADTAPALSVAITPNAVQSPTAPFFTAPNGDLYLFSEPASAGVISNTFRIRRYRRTTGMVDAIHPFGIGHTAAVSDITQCGGRGFAMAFDPTAQQPTLGLLLLGADDTAYPNCTPASSGTRSSIAALNPNNWQAQLPPPPHAAHSSDDYDSAMTTGADGRLYFIARASVSGILVYERSSNTWSFVVGTGIRGSCADGTPALACAIDPDDAYVTREGRVYFLDRGQLRMVDSSGTVRTLYGEAYSSGDGGHPLSARFGSITYFDRKLAGSASQIALYDATEARLRTLQPSTTVQTIAGNGMFGSGVIDVSLAATAQPLAPVTGFTYGPSGDLMLGALAASGAGAISRHLLRYQANLWSITAGSTLADDPDFDDLDNLPLSIVDLSAAQSLEVLGYDTTTDEAVMSLARSSGGTFSDMFIRRASYATDQLLLLAGVNDISTPPASWCDLTLTPATTACQAPPHSYMRAQVDYTTGSGRWLMASAFDPTTVAALYLPNPSTGIAMRLTQTASPMSAFAYHKDASAEEIVYCDTDGNLRRRNLITSSETAVALLPGMTCTGRAMVFVAPDAEVPYPRLLFAFAQHGLAGIAELNLGGAD